MEGEKKDEIEPAVVPTELQTSPPSKATSVYSGDHETEKKYETIQPPRSNERAKPHRNHELTLEKPKSVMDSSLNLLSVPEIDLRNTRKGVSVNTKLGIFQLVLSILLSAFGGLLIARNASLSMFGSGIWSGIFAGIAGSLGLMNIKPLLNGFLATSLVCVATSTLALALTGIGLVRDYNISQQDPDFEASVVAACGLTFLIVLHLFTSMFSVYYSALELCSNRDAQKVPNDMNYEKVQKYLKSLQNAGITGYDLNGYQNYINQSKLHRQRSRVYHPQHYQMPIYAASSGYMTNPRMYAPPSNYYHDYYYTHDEARRTPRESERPEKPSVVEDPNLSYTGADREMADSYLKSIEAKERGM